MAGKKLSNAAVDRLGEKLRAGSFGEEELAALDEYRRDFVVAYAHVFATVQRIAAVPVSGREAKSTTSIIEKLRRESIRLSQMQDVAGCRVVVGQTAQQNLVANATAAEFDDCRVIDRRERPSHGYRAVHVVVTENGRPIEVQIRTELQHAWAEVCERCADAAGPAVKYGGGPPRVRELLARSSALIALQERLESEAAAVRTVEIRSFVQDLRRMLLETLDAIVEFAEEEME